MAQQTLAGQAILACVEARQDLVSQDGKGGLHGRGMGCVRITRILRYTHIYSHSYFCSYSHFHSTTNATNFFSIFCNTLYYHIPFLSSPLLSSPLLSSPLLSSPTYPIILSSYQWIFLLLPHSIFHLFLPRVHTSLLWGAPKVPIWA